MISQDLHTTQRHRHYCLLDRTHKPLHQNRTAHRVLPYSRFRCCGRSELVCHVGKYCRALETGCRYVHDLYCLGYRYAFQWSLSRSNADLSQAMLSDHKFSVQTTNHDTSKPSSCISSYMASRSLQLSFCAST